MEQNKNIHGDILASWSFPSVESHKRSKGWFVVFFIIYFALILYAIFSGNFLFFLLLILFLLIYIINSRVKEEVLFSITQDGIEIANKFYRYKELDSFWIIYEPPDIKRLYFTTKGMINSYWSIPLNKKNPVEIRKILLKYLPEDLEKEDEPFIDTLSRIFKI